MTSYLDRIQAAVDAGEITQHGVTSVEVEHTPACRWNTPASRCTCHPRITAIVGNEALVIGDHGAILERSKRQ